MQQSTRIRLMGGALSAVVVVAILEGCNRWLGDSPYRVLVSSLLVFGVVVIHAGLVQRVLRSHEFDPSS